MGTHLGNRKAVSPDRLGHGIHRVEGNVADKVILEEEMLTRKLGARLMGLTWGEVARLGQDRNAFRSAACDLCPHLNAQYANAF